MGFKMHRRVNKVALNVPPLLFLFAKYLNLLPGSKMKFGWVLPRLIFMKKNFIVLPDRNFFVFQVDNFPFKSTERVLL